MNASGSPQPDGTSPPSRLTRRGFVVGGIVLAGAGGLAAARWFNISAEVGETALSAPQAHAKALAGAIALIDIRRPDEWAQTGVPEGAQALDMRRDDFLTALKAVAGDAPIALICARGVRSRHLGVRLSQAGFTQVLDVPEGMFGSGAGPGWLARELPVVPFEG